MNGHFLKRETGIQWRYSQVRTPKFLYNIYKFFINTKKSLVILSKIMNYKVPLLKTFRNI